MTSVVSACNRVSAASAFFELCSDRPKSDMTCFPSSSLVISSAPRGVRVEELGLYPAGGRAPDDIERLANALALLLAYALFLTAGALALSAFFVGRPAAALIAIAAGAVALWLVLEGESALDAQALDEFNG